MGKRRKRRRGEKNEEDKQGVDGVGDKDGGRGGRSIGATTPYTAIRTGRGNNALRCKQNRAAP